MSKRNNPAGEVADFLARYPDIQFFDAIYPDLCGLIRGKRYPAEQLEKVMTNGLATPGSVFLLDAVGENHDPDGLGFSDGDPDCQVHAIPDSLLPVPWAARPSAQVLLTFQDPDGTPYQFEPRNVLAATWRKLQELKLRPVVAFELEFFLIDKERLPDGGPQPPLSPLSGRRIADNQVYGMGDLEAQGELLSEITDSCTAQGIKTGAITAEYATGQYEINLHHMDDPLLAADQCVLFKRIVQGVARKHGIEATFMAKPYLDQAGSGLHMHCSLLDEEDNNFFAQGERAAEPDGVAPALRQAIAGVLDFLPESMAILAPNMNSFRRFVANNFVPVARSWGWENRSLGLRIPIGEGTARRIEHRIAGADANPYLALASFFAGIHHGLVKQLDPGPAWHGNAGETRDPGLPFRPLRALDRMAGATGLASYFGRAYVSAYVGCKMAELDKFESKISATEYAWYMTTD